MREAVCFQELRVPLELIYIIIRFTPPSDLLPFLSVSSSIRRETRILLYRDIKLSTSSHIIKFRHVVPDVGHHVRSIEISGFTTSDQQNLRTILTHVRSLKILQVGQSPRRFSQDIILGFLPTFPTFNLQSVIIQNIDPSVIRQVVPFIRTQSKSLVRLELPLLFSDYPTVFPRLRVLHIDSEAKWNIIRMGTVRCVSGAIGFPLPGEVFPAIRAVKDHLMRDPRTFLALPRTFPEVRFIQASLHVGCAPHALDETFIRSPNRNAWTSKLSLLSQNSKRCAFTLEISRAKSTSLIFSITVRYYGA